MTRVTIVIAHMRYSAAIVILVSIVLGSCGIHYLTTIPDLPYSEAEKIISRAPEFNRYARLLNVKRIDHLKESSDSVSYGFFTFAYLNSPSDAPPIKAFADFRYSDGWYLVGFDYGCDHSALYPEMREGECRSVTCYNARLK